MSDSIDLSEGDFVYQSDQELFLVVMGENENSYRFAVHGWREIDKERLDEYVSHDNGKLYRQGDIDEFVENEGNDDEVENFEQMKQMFASYADIDIEEDGPHTEFAMEDS